MEKQWSLTRLLS